MSESRNSIEGVLTTLRDIGWRPGAIIDIGVATGTAGLYSVWEDIDICLVEPSRKALVYMEQIAARYPRTKIFNVAASNRTGRIVGGEHPDISNISFGKIRGLLRKAVFPAMTCDDIVAAAGVSPPFVYKLDTDTHEREILEGSAATLARTELCIVEMRVFHRNRKGMARPDDIWRAMIDHGFAFFDVAGAGYAGSGVMRSADLVFAREGSPLFTLAMENSGKSANVLQRRIEQYARALTQNGDF
jgi:FkbM family methyltransferase